ncbi:MAG: hypothetical protein P1U32_06095 [Legionellaceae bacterium]|nr:hypothetical protein [Legionellaceae bacterium]
MTKIYDFIDLITEIQNASNELNQPKIETILSDIQTLISKNPAILQEREPSLNKSPDDIVTSELRLAEKAKARAEKKPSENAQKIARLELRIPALTRAQAIIQELSVHDDTDTLTDTSSEGKDSAKPSPSGSPTTDRAKQIEALAASLYALDDAKADETMQAWLEAKANLQAIEAAHIQAKACIRYEGFKRTEKLVESVANHGENVANHGPT